MTDEDEKELSLPTQNKKYESLFQRTNELNKNSVIKKKNCKLCNSKLRAEAEQMWEDHRRYSFAPIHKWLLTNGEDISINAVKNHLDRHYNKQLNHLRLSEYADKVNSMLEYDFDLRENVRTLVAITMNTLSEAVAMDDSNSKEQSVKIKNINETIKLLKDLTELEHQLNMDIDPVQLVNDKLNRVFIKMRDSAKTDEERFIIIDILNKLKTDTYDA